MMKHFFDYLPSNIISPTDMVRFNNTFTQNIYDGNGNFKNAVNGNNGPICAGGTNCNPKNPPINYFRKRVMSYMMLAQFDVYTNTTPNVYEVLMNHYSTDILGNPNASYTSGQDSRGHAYMVKEQWKRECTNLTLYNRKMVYNQDFFAKNDLTVLPGGRNGFTYAAPKNTNVNSPDYFVTNEFRVEPNVTVNMQAENRIELNPGFTAEYGSNFIAEIEPTLCSSSGARMATPNNNQNEKNGNNAEVSEEIVEQTISVIEVQNMMIVAPNPIKDKAVISFSIIADANITLQIFDIYGRLISTEIPQKAFQKGMHQVIINANKYKSGIYLCKLFVNNEVLTQKIVKQ